MLHSQHNDNYLLQKFYHISLKKLFQFLSLLKYDTGTLLGGRTEIEMRDIDEITSDWKTIPKGLKFLNPSFETVSRDLIGALITEKGIFPPEIVSTVVKDTYKWM